MSTGKGHESICFSFLCHGGAAGNNRNRNSPGSGTLDKFSDPVYRFLTFRDLPGKNLPAVEHSLPYVELHGTPAHRVFSTNEVMLSMRSSFVPAWIYHRGRPFSMPLSGRQGDRPDRGPRGMRCGCWRGVLRRSSHSPGSSPLTPRRREGQPSGTCMPPLPAPASSGREARAAGRGRISPAEIPAGINPVGSDVHLEEILGQALTASSTAPGKTCSGASR